MALTKFDIASRALTRIGGNVITSFEDDSAEAIAAGREYEPTVTGALSSYPWRFATALRAIGGPLEDTPAGLWTYAWEMPEDALAITGAWRSDKAVAYDIYGTKIFTDEDADLVLEFTFRSDEGEWPGYFVEAITSELAWKLALSLARDQSLAEGERRLAQRLWAIARNRDSVQQTTRRVPVGGIVARRGWS